MSHPANQALYFVPPGHSMLAGWQATMVEFSKPEIHTISPPIDPELVDHPQTASVQQLILTLQHYPKLIEKAVFGIKFLFRQVAGSDLYYQELDWKNDAKYYRWFHRLSSQPIILFFLQDHDARFYFLTGDWLAANKVISQAGKDGKRSAVKFNEEQTLEMANRFFTSCRMFKLFCHGTGFDPAPYIESLISEYHFEESDMLQMINTQYLEDIMKEVRVSVFPQQS